MTNAEYADESFERHLPKWERLDLHVRQQIERTSAMIELADEVVTAHEVARLNKSLKSEGLLSIPMQVTTALPTFVGKVLTESGAEETPVVDKDLMKRTSFTGTFKGCVAMGLQSEPMNLLFYDVELSKDDNHVILRVPTDASKVVVEYPELDGWEKEADGAFSVLETVEDEDYQSAAEGLADAFWNTDQPLVVRLRTIGIYASELLSYPMHLESQELQDALGVILLCSLDEDTRYDVKGFYVDESREESGRPVIDVTYSERNRIMKPVGVRYMTNFEIVEVQGQVVDAQVGTTLQPAFTFFDTKERVELDYPMRFISRIEEYEHTHDFPLEQVRQIELAGINRWASIEKGKTCGEWVHEYSQKHDNGV